MLRVLKFGGTSMGTLKRIDNVAQIIKKFKIRKNVRFLYENGELKQIDLKEFRELNKGARW